MDDSEKYLSVYQHQNCLRLVDWNLWEDDTPDQFQIPHLLSNSKILDSHQEEVNKFFRSYLEEKFTNKDYKLLKGVFCNEDLKNNELQMINYEEGKSESGMSRGNSSIPDHDIQINHTIRNHHKQAKFKFKK